MFKLGSVKKWAFLLVGRWVVSRWGFPGFSSFSYLTKIQKFCVAAVRAYVKKSFVMLAMTQALGIESRL